MAGVKDRNVEVLRKKPLPFHLRLLKLLEHLESLTGIQHEDAPLPPLCSPVRPTLLRHMKHLFFLGLGVSPLLSSLLEEATGAGLEAAG